MSASYVIQARYQDKKWHTIMEEYDLAIAAVLAMRYAYNDKPPYRIVMHKSVDRRIVIWCSQPTPTGRKDYWSVE